MTDNSPTPLSPDIQLVYELSEKFGRQQLLAERLGVSASAVSNWIKADRLPTGARHRLMQLKEQLDNPAAVATPPTGAEGGVPEDLQADVKQCGFWARSAWSFHHLSAHSNKGANDAIWRSWNSVNVSKHTVFRHNTRFRPFGKLSEGEVHDDGTHGFGFLKSWEPDKWRKADQTGGTQAYLAASADLAPVTGERLNGGYYVMAKESVLPKATAQNAYEFVTFRPECPAQQVHLVLSVPRDLRGAGPMTAYRVALDWSQLYDIAGDIKNDEGNLAREIRPWGRQLAQQTLTPADIDTWAADWGDDLVVQTIREKFVDDPDRQNYIVTDDHPLSLATLVLLWPLPTG